MPDQGKSAPRLKHPSSAHGRQDGNYRPPVLVEPKGGPVPTWSAPDDSRKVAAAADGDEQQKAWQAGVSALLATWPVLSVPLVNALASQVAAAAGVGGLAYLSVPQNVLDGLAAAVEQAMADVALDAAVAEAAEAEAAGVVVDPPTPDGSRLAEVAVVTAALIGVAYIATATRTALQAGPDAAEGAVREALTAIGTATTGPVVDHVRVAMSAAQNTGRRAVFEAHPPREFRASEHRDPNACGPCRDVDGKTYPTLDVALVDYPGNAGFRGCAGGLRCRGHIVAVWT